MGAGVQTDCAGNIDPGLEPETNFLTRHKAGPINSVYLMTWEGQRWTVVGFRGYLIGDKI